MSLNTFYNPKEKLENSFIRNLKSFDLVMLTNKQAERVFKTKNVCDMTAKYPNKLIVYYADKGYVYRNNNGVCFAQYYINNEQAFFQNLTQNIEKGLSFSNSILLAERQTKYADSQSTITFKKWITKFDAPIKVKFGTSGCRGEIDQTFDHDVVKRIAYAIVKLFKPDKSVRTVAVGYDNRFNSRDFAVLVAEVLTAYGYKVMFYNESVPSPLVSYASKIYDLGIMITASHNPFSHNGIKVFTRGGVEANRQQADYMERVANKVNSVKIKTLDFNRAITAGKIELTKDIKPYCQSVIALLDAKKITESQPNLLINAMHGSSVNCLKYICEKLKLKKYEIINTEYDCFFGGIQPAPYVGHLTAQGKKIVGKKYSLGFAVDGDGDRLTIVDKDGKFYDCNYVCAIVIHYFAKYKNITGRIVKNNAMSSLITKVAKDNNCTTQDAQTGFAQITSIMLQNPDSYLGAESNSICLKNHIYSKDGILGGMLVTDALCTMQKTFGEVVEYLKEVEHYPCAPIEYAYPITESDRARITKQIFEDKLLPDLPIVKVEYECGCKMYFKNDYWACIRFSGSENVLRLFSEQSTLKKSNDIIKILEDFVNIHTRQE